MDHHLGSGCCTLRPALHPCIFFLTFPNDYAPARTYQIPLPPPGGSQELPSIFIWMMSAEILRWHLTVRFANTEASHSSIPRRAPLCSCCNCVSSNPSKLKNHTCTSALFRIAPNLKKKKKKTLRESARGLACLGQRKSHSSTETLTVFRARLNLKCLSHECSYANKISGSSAK